MAIKSKASDRNKEMGYPKLMIGPVNNILLATGKTSDGDYKGMIIHNDNEMMEDGVGTYCDGSDGCWSRDSFKDYHGTVTLGNK